MNDVFEQARLQLARAKAVYSHALKAVDATLAGIVSRDPSALEAARDIQASYIEDIHPRELAAAEQPPAPVSYIETVTGDNDDKLNGKPKKDSKKK